MSAVPINDPPEHEYSLEEAEASLESAFSEPARQPSASASERPQIIVNDGQQEGDLVNLALDLLSETNAPPVLFEYMNQLARIRTTDAGICIEVLNRDRSRSVLAQTINFVAVTTDEDGNAHYRAATMPGYLANQVLAADRGERFPLLHGTITAPTILPDGHLIITPGYDADSGLYYHPAGIGPITVPESPSVAEIDAARSLLVDELFGEFSFVSASDLANAVALLLTTTYPDSFTGRPPIVLADANQQGTGKTLLVHVCHLIGQGRASTVTPTNRNEELQKIFTAMFQSGQTLVAFDNMEGVIKSHVWAEVATSRTWLGRRLNHSEITETINRLVISISGNNLSIGGDLDRRCMWIKLRAVRFQAWRRTFTRPDLEGWTLDHRTDLIQASLTLLSGWHTAGRPLPDNVPTFGSFQAWTNTMAGVLAYADIDGFLTNTDEATGTANDDDTKWVALLTVAENTWTDKGGWFTTAEFTERIEATLRALGADAPEIPTEVSFILADSEKPEIRKSRIGIRFRLIADRRFDATGIRLEALHGPGAQAQKWRVARDGS